MKSHVKRREFLNLLAAFGGTGAALNAGAALNLLPAASHAQTLDLRSPDPSKKQVVILGGGLSGLTVAYELTKRGYDCTVLEASHRCGGRVLTVRHGDLIDEIGNPQYCSFDDEPHMYFNAGAARIPSSHKNILGYCKELGVDLEVFINENKSAYVQDDKMLSGNRIRNIEFTTNMRGFMAELMAKALTHEELNQPFSDAEAEALLSSIRAFGDLKENDLYEGSFRAGYKSGGFLKHGVQKDMIAFRDLLKSRLGRQLLSANEGDTGPILMQPVGGMDKIISGFLNHVGERVKYRAIVNSVEVLDSGVKIVYDHDGARQSFDADYCFNCIPTHLMVGITNNFPDDYKKAMKYVRRGDAYKAAFQAKSRFWEDQEIYGGISWSNSPSRQIWYPSHGIHKSKGIVLAAYDYGGGIYHTQMSQSDRIEAHLSDAEKIHPDFRHNVENPITVAWHRMNHMLGCSARWQRSFSTGWTHDEEKLYETLRAPVNNRHFFIGDQISMHSAWQESAVMSAQWALTKLDAYVRQELA